MSGGGTSGGPGGGFNSGGGQTPCGELKFKAFVASPQPAAESLQVGEILSVALDTGPPAVINLLNAEAEVVGSLVTKVSDLLRCIQDGYAFEAEVLAIDGGKIEVAVRPA